ncbi:MAG TPA: hypothetical protein VK770_06770 [Candidatus Acidoferrum sp.]|jgi:hypothetical protein|nr:hypothetical protein [Candidatus Acidoferrum sp.]
MTTSNRDGHSQGILIDVPKNSDEGGSPFVTYLQESRQKLRAIIDLLDRGEVVDHDSHSWMLAQVDFIVDLVGNDDLELGAEIRGDLLQFLLAVANLNEQIRQQASMRR